jgi:glycosyltransferase involved in cell wall biosynthesis
MRIGIDASRAFMKERTGTEEYSYQFLRNLADSGQAMAWEVVLYVKEKMRPDFELPSNFTLREIRGNFLWTRYCLSRELLKNPVDVFFAPAHGLPFFSPARSVVTVHGLEYKTHSECYPFIERLVFRINDLLSLRSAAKIIVPSESTKMDLMAFYSIAEGKISVIHHGAPEIREKDKGVKDKKDGFWIFFIGRLERRKNVIKLVRAFEMAKEKAEARHSGRKMKLILAGKDGFKSEEIRLVIGRSRHREDIILKGYVSAQEKEDLFQKADVFLFPTLAEGFGLPVLEAMSYGVPVIASRIPALVEVAGTSALMVNPENEEEIAEAIGKLFGNEEERKELARKGYENLRRFSWQECVRKTWAILTEWGDKEK